MPSRYPVQTVTAQAKNRIRIAPGRARRKAIDRFTLDGDPDCRDEFLIQIKGRPFAVVLISHFFRSIWTTSWLAPNRCEPATRGVMP